MIDSTADRPTRHLRWVMSQIPELSDIVNAAFSVRENYGDAEWPRWCFMPRGLWYGLLVQVRGNEFFAEPAARTLATKAHIIGTWRYGQGVYDFAPEIFEAIVESDAPGKLPAEVFLRLPEWCIYVSTPTLRFYGQKLYGFYALLDRADNTDYLIVATDADDGIIAVPIPLGGMTILEAIDSVLATYSNKQGYNLGALAKTMAEDMSAIISLLLYICSDAPEIDDTRTPGLSPFRAYPKRVKGGYKMFPATSPHVWRVGEQASAALRNIGYVYTGERGGHKKRPHLRRGHWNLYWYGKRSSENRTCQYKFIPPMIVGTGEN